MKYKRHISISIPKGYFYKHKFLTPFQTLKALIKDKKIKVIEYKNGPYEYKGKLYSHLKQLYNDNMQDFDMAYSMFLRRYSMFEINHIEAYNQGYVHLSDNKETVYFNYEALLNEICNENDLMRSEQYEKYYLIHNCSDTYFNHSVKERIAILENWERN